ncbi:MAG TPA: hypothetical protein PLC89_27765, partial [Haliscomenobacter sp.]|uniref:PKD-like domain-containing protein n=1 Tax=Haliscomenobacter sp. TaxID=2717303 RepID=UPI002CD689C1
KCGGSVKIRIVITDDCDQRSEKEATYTITRRSDIVINTPADKTVRCLLQPGIDTEFSAWIAQFNTSGGCSASVKYYVNDQEVANLNDVDAPSECGGKVTIRIVMTDLCDQTLTQSAYFEAIPKPVGLPKEKTIYSCIEVDVNLQLQVKCDVRSTFTWYSVAAVGSSDAYNNPNVDGETFNPVGTSNVINDVLTNLSGNIQTIIYRVVPTSTQGCVGDPFYVTVTIRPKANIECLACMSQVTVSLNENCKLKITPEMVIEGFIRCPNKELLRDALEVLIDDGKNNDSYIDCAGTYNYIIRLKPEYEACFDYAPCWGKITAEDKTGPILECEDFIEKTLDCYDVTYVLNNPKTIGKVGATKSPRPAASGNQTINNAEGTGETCADFVPPVLIEDNVPNLGYAFFRDNCHDCGCRINLKWSDKVEFYDCE